MQIGPSKELLSEVLGIKQFCTGKHLKENCFGYPYVKMKGYPFTLNDDEEFAIRNNELCYGFINIVENPHREIADFRFINIHELAHKCKEWALKNGYSLLTGIFIVADDEDNAVFDYFYSCLVNYIKSKDREHVLNNFKSETEPEAIFKACEWIKEQK